MKRVFLYILPALMMFIGSCCKQEPMDKLIERVMYHVEAQYIAMDANLTSETLPRSYAEGKFIASDNEWWCSGFYPGALWYIYEYTGNEEVKALAHKNTRKLDGIYVTVDNHDLGFQLHCSYGNALRITGDESYLDQWIPGAYKLAGRFSEKTGVIRSWDFIKPGFDWKYPVIVDNMMNLEYLTAVSKHVADPKLTDIAVSHTEKTLQNHFQPDGTCYHLVDYDPEDGSIRQKQTVQGYSDTSMWARGEGWALYGFTVMYRETGDEDYLAQAEKIAKLLLSELPEDGVPYWDFDSPDIPNDFRDSSAGSLMASAFVELSTLTKDAQLSKDCLAMAEKQIRTLSTEEYLAPVGSNGNFLLKHAVGSRPEKHELDGPLTYGDYYYVEALVRYAKLLKNI